MPNHVYNNIEVEEKYASKLEAISKVGLAQYFKPRPKAFEDTRYPMPKKKDDPYKYELGQLLLKHYGHDNWYEWSYNMWGTKWGTYDDEFHKSEHRYTYTTAWSPLHDSIIEMLAEEIPTFSYNWEEEQGYGAVYEFENGERTFYKEYDIPSWEETEYEEIQYLAEDYESACDGNFRKGYYYHWSLHEYLGNNLDEAKKYLDSN